MSDHDLVPGPAEERSSGVPATPAPDSVSPTPAPPESPARARLTTEQQRLLTKLNEHGFRLIMMADALVLLAIAFGTQFAIHGWAWPTYPKPLYVVSFLLITALYLATFYFGGLYEREPRLGPPPALPRVTRHVLAATGLFAILEFGATSGAQQLGYFTERALPMPLTNLVVLFVLGAVAVAGNRKLANWLRLNREGPPRILLVGAPDEVNVARSHIGEEQNRARVVGAATSADDLVAKVAELLASEVVLLSSRWLDDIYPTVISTLEDRHVNVLLRVTGKETMFGLERVRQVGGMPFVLLRLHTLPRSRAHFKRFTDLIALLVSAPIVVPIVTFTALYVLLVAGRPVLYRQERVGAAGRRFDMIKFRTMYPDAEEDGRPQLATRDDPRIIPACRWLRSTRLDELPQIWNVVRGEMSLIGPRPERVEFAETYEQLIPGYESRHEIPPGITGLAQIHGRYHTDPEYKLGYDLQYVVNWSPVLDLEILARTVWVVLTRRV